MRLRPLLTVPAARCCGEGLLFQKGSQMLDIYKVALELARAVGVQGGRIAGHDKDLVRQMRRDRFGFGLIRVTRSCLGRVQEMRREFAGASDRSASVE